MTTFGVINPAASSRLAALTADAAADAPAGAVSLYIHVPFCASKCAYCDFYSIALNRAARGGERWLAGDDGRFADPVDEFMTGAALGSFLGPVLGDVPTLYVGGGTPTLLGERLVELLAQTGEYANLRPDAEVTVEANPDSVTRPLMSALAAAGVTRVSLGVQSFDDGVLETLGRRHDARQADAAAAAVLAAGMRLSIDLMCGVPGQSEASWRESLRRAVDAGVGHMSVYPLSVEPGTPLAARVAAGAVPAPDADAAAEMMLTAEEILGQAGLQRYEVANYARPGEESRHNLRYWTGGEYVGVGPEAASMLSPATLAEVPYLGEATLARLGIAPDDGGRVRFTVNSGLDDFATAGWDRDAVAAEYLTPAEAAREDVMLGLRLTRGIEDALVERAGRRVGEALHALQARGLVERSPGGGAGSPALWRATTRGWLLGNEVFAAVWNTGDD